VLRHMDEHGHVQVTPRLRDPDLPREPFIDLKSGYVLRSLDRFPKQGPRPPWRLHQNYLRDILMLRREPLEDGTLEFAGSATSAREPAEASVAA